MHVHILKNVFFLRYNIFQSRANAHDSCTILIFGHITKPSLNMHFLDRISCCSLRCRSGSCWKMWNSNYKSEKCQNWKEYWLDEHQVDLCSLKWRSITILRQCLPHVVYILLANTGAWSTYNFFAFPAISKCRPLDPSLIRMCALTTGKLKAELRKRMDSTDKICM